MKTRTGKLAIVIFIVALIVAFVALDLHRYLTLDYLKSQQQAFDTYYQAHKLSSLLIYFCLYVLVTALSLPGAAVLTLAGAGLFGFWLALLVVSFASSIGATGAFLVSRFLLHDWVQNKFGNRLKAINSGVEKEGAFYLFSLRLVPIFPFFVINLVMGLTPLKVGLYYIVSQIGMLPGTIVYVNAGTQLGQLESAAGILSPALLLSFALLGIFPLVAKRLLNLAQARKVYAGYKRPSRYDYNLIVIGAGSAGLVSAYIATAVKAKVALIEKADMGGDCLNSGCVPSKALISSAKLLAQSKKAADFGLDTVAGKADFPRIMQRVKEKIARIAPHDSVERYQKLGAEVIKGEARVTSPWTVEVNGRTLTTRSIIIASGGSPFIPPLEGIENVPYLTSENLWQLTELPQRLVVLGGGPIGCELSQAFSRLGSQVSLVEMSPQLLGKEDDEVSRFAADLFDAEGINVLTGHKAQAIKTVDGQQQLVCQAGDSQITIPFDQILVAVGRTANVKGFGLEELGIELNNGGTVVSDPFLRTRFPNIFCAGDVAGPYQFTHTASHQAWYAAVNALFGQVWKFKADYRVIPWCTFTDPEIARVGINEREAKQQGIAYEVTRYDLEDLDRAITENVEQGWVKILTRPGSDKILGVTIVGAHAGDVLAEFVLAMKHGLGLNKVLGTIHSYPTFAEMNKMAAGQWKKAHAPQQLLSWVAKYHRWRRG